MIGTTHGLYKTHQHDGVLYSDEYFWVHCFNRCRAAAHTLESSFVVKHHVWSDTDFETTCIPIKKSTENVYVFLMTWINQRAISKSGDANDTSEGLTKSSLRSTQGETVVNRAHHS
jgi:hypothetical protein